MNKEKIDAACDLINGIFKERPEMIRAVITMVWWAGYDRGRRSQVEAIIKSLGERSAEGIRMTVQ